MLPSRHEELLSVGHTHFRLSVVRSVLARCLIIATALLIMQPTAAAARPWLCLPPIFDGGQRLHPLPNPSVFWLELLLRQHDICWHRPGSPREARIALFGNSAIYGFPLPVAETFGSLLNQHFSATGLPARLFNLGFVATSQVRDALIIHQALQYDPDVIVYPLTLADFRHVYLKLHDFYVANQDTLAAMVARGTPGLDEPLQKYAATFIDPRLDLETIRKEAGLFVRLSVRTAAESLAARLGAKVPEVRSATSGRQPWYDCAAMTRETAIAYGNWKTWNILAYLDEIKRTRGVRVLVVNWPIAHEPVGSCYSVRYTDAAVADFVQWLAAESAARGFDYLDLHDLLPAELFVDSLHVSAKGHRRIAAAVARTLDPMLRELE